MTTTEAPPRPSFSAYLQLLRLPAVFTAWADVLAAHLIATGGQPRPAVLLLQIGISTCLYWAGMVLNDCFDLDLDRRERPQRPLPAGRIGVSQAWALGWGLLVLGALLGLVAGGPLAVLAPVLALAVLAYDAWLKGSAVWGPVVLAACRGLNWLLGLSAAPLTWGLASLALPTALYVGSVAVLARVEADPRGRLPLGLCALGLVLTLGVVTALFVFGPLGEPLALLPLLALGGWVLARLRRLAQEFEAAPTQALVGRLLAGIIVLDALLVLGAGLGSWGLAVILLLLPAAWLGRTLAMS